MSKDKLKMWDRHPSWNEAEAAWDNGACQAAEKHPIKSLKQLPTMIGITPDTAKHLKWKSLKWMVKEDRDFTILKGVLRHPFKYGWGYIKSIFKRKPYRREGDLFFYGVENKEEFIKLLNDPNNLFVLGFSYCHKPFECPSGRFTSECKHDQENLVCRQCFIGKAFHAAPAETIPLCIPTIHYIGGKIFEILHDNPHKKLIFIITACEMTLEMFGDWGNMTDIKGIGVRLDGRICNTMQAFELSEKGVKPGLTVVLDSTKEAILNLLRQRRDRVNSSC